MRTLLAILLLGGSLGAQVLQPYNTSLNNVTSTGAGQQTNLAGQAQNWVYPIYTWQVNFKTAAPTAQTTNLEGSLDGTNWYTLDTSTNLAYTSDSQSGEMRHVVNKSVVFLRCNLATYTAGSNAGVACKIYVKGYER